MLLDEFRRRFKVHAEAAQAPIIVVAITAEDPLSNLARALEHERFNQVGIYSGGDLHDEFDSWEPASHFLVAIDTETVRPVGSLRGIVTVAGIGQPAKTVHDALVASAFQHTVRYDLDGNEVIDLRDHDKPTHQQLAGTVGVSCRSAGGSFDRTFIEDYHQMRPGDVIYDVAMVCNDHESGHLAAAGPMLYSAASRMVEKINAKHCVAVLRTDVQRMLVNVMKMPFEPLAGLGCFRHCDGDDFDSRPLYFSIDEVGRIRAREVRRRQTLQPSVLGRRACRFIDLMVKPENDRLFLL